MQEISAGSSGRPNRQDCLAVRVGLLARPDLLPGKPKAYNTRLLVLVRSLGRRLHCCARDVAGIVWPPIAGIVWSSVSTVEDMAAA